MSECTCGAPDPTPAELATKIADALNQLEDLDIDVQMPARINALGSRVDAGTLTFDRYADGERVATVEWDDSRWVVAQQSGEASQ